jgi:hypothetical protein
MPRVKKLIEDVPENVPKKNVVPKPVREEANPESSPEPKETFKITCTWADDDFLTEGKEYETTGLDLNGQYPVICDNGELRTFNQNHFNGKRSG